MAHTYKGYRVESARLAGWDYRSPAHYFVTICTKDHYPWLGRIIDAEAYVSPIGLLLAEEWLRTPYLRPNVALDLWVVMPNHFHGILILTNPDTPSLEPAAPAATRSQAGTLGTIIGHVKASVTKQVRGRGNAEFDWQPRFHDHIIRDEKELQRIRDYIIGNPGKWYEDRYYRSDA